MSFGEYKLFHSWTNTFIADTPFFISFSIVAGKEEEFNLRQRKSGHLPALVRRQMKGFKQGAPLQHPFI
ncbi:hypothetical protein TGS27_1975 [Geobacillus stearothermophilus]|nr:hypothetical protein TGS27_1975 [Geobacillus stearothermophilus]